MLTSLLSPFFKDEEIQTYITLLEEGPLSARILAQKLSIPRSSVYGFVQKLQDKGLITQSIQEGTKIFTAEQPEKINFLFTQAIESLTTKQHSFEKLIPELKKNLPSAFIPPSFQLFEGQEGLQQILKDMLLYRDMPTEAFWPIEDMIDILTPDFFRYLNKIRIRNNLYTRAIWPSEKKVPVKDHPYLGVGDVFKREIRIAPKGITTSMGYWIYGNRVACISSRRESFGFIIESSEFSGMLRTQFDLLWDTSTPLEVRPQDTASFIETIQ